MCRNIKPLFNFEPPVTDSEVRDAALQFVRKISGFRGPSKLNEAAFHQAVDDITTASSQLLRSLKSSAEPKTREQEAALRRSRSLERFGPKR